MQIATEPPFTFEAGETLQYRASLAHLGFTPSTHSLKLFLRGASVLDVEGIADGDAWLVQADASATADLVTDTYEWSQRATSLANSELVYPAGKGLVFVGPNRATATAGQLTSYDEKLLAGVRGQILERVAKDVSRMSAFERAIEREKLTELRQIEAECLSNIAARRRRSTRRPNEVVSFRQP